MEPGLEISIPQNDAHHRLHPVAQTPSSWLLAPVVDDRLFGDFSGWPYGAAQALSRCCKLGGGELLSPSEAGALAAG